MVVVFVRHGEKRGGESDPGLTSWGRRMASETGRWLSSQGIRPTAFWLTPTQRTRETTEELLLAMGVDAPQREVRFLPEDEAGWEALLRAIKVAEGEAAVVVCVGHHPTVDLLRSQYALPVRIPPQNAACAIIVEGQPGGTWHCQGAWPGRP